MVAKKTLNNENIKQTTKSTPDIKVFGDGDAWKLICKASSEKEGWMKSTKAMDVGNGCLVQVTTQQGTNVSEAVTFVPNVTILEIEGKDTDAIKERRIVPIFSVRGEDIIRDNTTVLQGISNCVCSSGCCENSAGIRQERSLLPKDADDIRNLFFLTKDDAITCFTKQVKIAINYGSLENYSDTPDFISACFLTSEFEYLNKLILERRAHHNGEDSKEDLLAFEKDLILLIKEHKKNKVVNIPAYILARFINRTVNAVNIAVGARRDWYGYPEKESADIR